MISSHVHAYHDDANCPANWPLTSSNTESYTIVGNSMTFSSLNQTFLIEEQAQVNSGVFLARSSKFVYQTQTGDLLANHPTYIEGRQLRLWSSFLHLESDNHLNVKDTVFTRCAGDTADELDWHLSATRVQYNPPTEDIDLYHPVLWFHDVPIFYFPWVNVPLKRRSGLLMPNIGYHTLHEYDTKGYFLQLPIYIDIANNVDTTFYLTSFENRGMLVSNQFRYLTEKGKGTLYLDWKDSDSVLNQAEPESNHYERLYFTGSHQLATNLSLSANWLHLNPRKFYEYFHPSMINVIHTGSFNRDVDLKYQTSRHKTGVTVTENYSLISIDQNGYQQLPKIYYNYNRSLVRDLKFAWNSNFTRYVSPWKRNLRNYQLYNFNPALSWVKSWSYLTTSFEAGGIYNTYQLDEYNNNSTIQESEDFQFSTAYAKLGSEWYFNNKQWWMSSRTVSTLNPMLYYLYSPYQDPKNIPFATYTARKIDTPNSLTNIYRYSRTDFVGESNRVVAGISQHLGIKSLQNLFSIGHNIDITKSKTDSKLPQEDIGYQSWFASYNLIYHSLRGQLSTQWNKDTRQYDRAFGQIYYEDPQKNVFRINYLETPHNTQISGRVDNQRGVGLNLNINNHWQVAFQQNYNTEKSIIINNLFGVAYDSCCWKIFSYVDIKRNTDATIAKTDKEFDYTILFHFILKGLGSVGSDNSAGNTIYKRVSGT